MQGFLMSVAFGDDRPVDVHQCLELALPQMLDAAAHRLSEPGAAPDNVRVAFVLEADGILDDHVGVAADSQTFVACYGEVDDRSGAPAERLIEACRNGGFVGTGAIHGCYGAALVNKATGEVTLTGDGLGQRNLRYCWLDGRLLVATHDIFLVAAGVPVALSRIALASVLRFGWSFGNESLLAGVETVVAEQAVVVRADRTSRAVVHPAHAHAAEKRARGVDVAATREKIVQELANYVRVNRRAGTPLEVELSAGFDSRAVVSLAHYAAGQDVRAFTDGPPDSQDARVARKVAAALQIPHRAGGTAHNTASSRLAYVHEVALCTSGQATAMVAMTSADRTLAESPDSLGGDGGEVFRGYYYPKIGRRDRDPFSVAKLADWALGKFTGGARLLSPELESGLRRFVEARLQRLAPHCRFMADGYDLVYLIERTGTWNQKLRRMTSADRRRNPFYSRAALFEYLTLPGSRARISHIHETVMSQMAPQALWIPLNGESIPALMAGSASMRAISKTVTLAAKVMWKVRDKVGKAGRAGTGQGDLEDVRIQKLIGHIDDDWAGLLGGHSVARELIGNEEMDRLIAAAKSVERWACETIANVVVVETFFSTARRVAGVR